MMEFHPLAEVLPLMEGQSFADLVADIKANGLREPIMVYEDKVLDGRNRFRACQEIGVQPELEYLNGQDPVAYVVSMNVHRRHLTTSQRAFIAAELAGYKHGGNRKSDQAANLPLAQAEAAKLLNVSERSVRSAALVRDHGTPEEKTAVRSGEKAASDIAHNIRQRARHKAEGGEPPGARVKVPDGVKTIEQWCRSGLVLEGDGAVPNAAAKSIGFPIQSYRKVRDIIQLYDRADLPAKDSEIVKAALARLNRSRRVAACHAMIEPIARRVWGQRRDIKESNRRAQFETAVAVLVQACATGSKMEVPHLDKSLASDVICQLEQARRELGKLIALLKETYHDQV